MGIRIISEIILKINKKKYDMTQKNHWIHLDYYKDQIQELRKAIRSGGDQNDILDLRVKITVFKSTLKREHRDTLQEIRNFNKVILKLRSFLLEDYSVSSNHPKSRAIHNRCLGRLNYLLEKRADVVSRHIDLEEFLEKHFDCGIVEFVVE